MELTLFTSSAVYMSLDPDSTPPMFTTLLLLLLLLPLLLLLLLLLSFSFPEPP